MKIRILVNNEPQLDTALGTTIKVDAQSITIKQPRKAPIMVQLVESDEVTIKIVP